MSTTPVITLGASPGPARAVMWRRRLAVVVAMVGVAMLARALIGGFSAPVEPAPPGPMVPASQRSYLVKRGDTLWTIARAVEPRGDVRPVVDRLAKDRRDRPLRVGERIVLP